MVRISVVMPVYNGAARVRPTVESILAQTFHDFELIVVDDGSTDATPEILAEFARRDPRVRLLRQENAGITRALIAGCRAAHAPLVARHDCGDRSHPERLARQATLFDDASCVLAATATTYLAPEGELLYTISANGDDVRRSLRQDGVDVIRGLPHHGSAMFRRDAYEQAGGYREAFYFAQDLDLWMRLAPLGTIRILDQPLYEATIDAGAISSRNRAEQVASARIAIALRDGGDAATLLAQARAIRPAPRRPAGRRAEASALYFIASCLRKNGDPAWRRYLRESLRRNPIQLRGWLTAMRGR